MTNPLAELTALADNINIKHSEIEAALAAASEHLRNTGIRLTWMYPKRVAGNSWSVGFGRKPKKGGWGLIAQRSAFRTNMHGDMEEFTETVDITKAPTITVGVATLKCLGEITAGLIAAAREKLDALEVTNEKREKGGD